MRARSLSLEFAPFLFLFAPTSTALTTPSLFNENNVYNQTAPSPPVISCDNTTVQPSILPYQASILPRLSILGSGKRGLAYEDSAQALAFNSPAIGWSYNWNARPPQNVVTQALSLGTGLGSFVPMLWGERAFEAWAEDAEWAIKNGATAFLGFNEPDHAEQANLSPEQAVQYWMEHMQPYAGRVRLGSPATTNSNNPGQGLSWMREFLSICADLGCTIDFLAVHWYNTDPVGSVQRFKDYITEVANLAGGRSVWVTEFGVWGAPDDVQANWLEEVMPWLDSNPAVEKYAYFAAINNHLVSNGQLTQTGQVYNSA